MSNLKSMTGPIQNENGVETGAPAARVVVSDSAGNLFQAGVAITATANEINTGTVAGLTATAAELNRNHSVTPGTTRASSTVVVDANKSVDVLNATTVSAGKDAVAGTMQVFPTTTAKGKTTFTADDNTGNTTTNIKTALQAAARTYNIPDHGADANVKLEQAPLAITADGAVTQRSGIMPITKAGVAVLTIADPITADNGKTLTLISTTANAHTLSNAAGSGFNAGGAGTDVGTFGGAIGDSITLLAWATKWLVVAKTNVTLG